jgi:hypothetical protein
MSHSEPIGVEIVCRDCKDGRHGCAGAWTGMGIEIHCVCDCVKKAAPQSDAVPSTTEASRLQPAESVQHPSHREGGRRT